VTIPTAEIRPETPPSRSSRIFCPCSSPCASDGSLMVKRLEGTIKPQMPADRAALSDNEILTVRLWIQEGAQNN